MSPREEIPPEVLPRAYYRQPVWKRLVVIGAGPAMNVLVAFAILWGLYAFSAQRARTDQRASWRQAGDPLPPYCGRRRVARGRRSAGTPGSNGSPANHIS